MDRIENCISFQIGKAAQQISRRAKELLAPYGVTPVQYAILKCLDESAGMSGAELGARIVLDSASITGVIDRLVTLGLVERRPDSNDRRVQRLYLTPKSKAQQLRLDKTMGQLNREAGRLLGTSGPRFTRLLQKLGERKNWSADV
ncbi:MarR family winged helix-turn-helix transcriptional regulator [Pelagibius marinus]|uniref:MarR family winged helix-turn-helix transcriptional regulator n=1 Tax=Pelagibius marinus TaxID=2762760 RepID=UPI0018724FC8|nr:MarR family transcriptional regulator [Pelagibius marinus]